MEENTSGKFQVEIKPLMTGGKMGLNDGPSPEEGLKTYENMESSENLKSDKEQQELNKYKN